MDNLNQTIGKEIQNPSTRILIKGIITGVLILGLMIPTLFIVNLVDERKERQREVVKEVSSKWGGQQTLTGPYIFLPFLTIEDVGGKTIRTQKHVWILPEQLSVTGTVTPEVRRRSIYDVLLYRAQIQTKGVFHPKLPKGIDSSAVQWKDSKICYGVSDYRGIEQRMVITANAQQYDLSPGLPDEDINRDGLSAPLTLSASDLGKPINFDMNFSLRGSETLYCVPLAGNSVFKISSSWNAPSFDGTSLPIERKLTENGFEAHWQFNKANLPFGTLLQAGKFESSNFAFGLNMLQPTDNYAKTSRSVKYAILFIGLTFALFFIVELLQKKPLHSVQYVLVGLALVIFYSLLLSFSEFISFDLSYLFASVATVFLVTWYTYSHFKTWKAAGAFFTVLASLYIFTFVLVRLEDTALLIGSIGLFIILSLVMIASRKINWYNPIN